jgi:NTP pyrophosphatase (non-canonical NTP hydrolase)
MRDYEEQASEYAVYRDPSYPYYGLVEEVGEVYSLFAKYIRDDVLVETDVLEKELGDVLWNLTQIANDNNISMCEVMETNLKKLESRQHRSVLHGYGDNR